MTLTMSVHEHREIIKNSLSYIYIYHNQTINKVTYNEEKKWQEE